MKTVFILLLIFICITIFSQTPTYEFIIEPTTLMNSYYDYMPGGYNNIPVHIQPEISYPNGHPAGGIYIVFHAQETSPSERYVYYSYIDSQGNVISTDLISTNNVRQGYVGIDIDPITCNPICSWHAHVEVDDSFDCLLSSDVFYTLGSFGNWTDEFIVIDNPEVGLPSTGFDDEFIWPGIYISDSSPLGGDYRRVYVTANNNTPSHGASGYPCENVLLGYADFLSSDLIDLSSLDWSYRTIEQMDAWSAENPYQRPFKACAVHDNIIVYAGYVVNVNNYSSEIFILVNENYGEGPFEYYSHSDISYNNANYSRYMNLVFRDDYSKISFVGVRSNYIPRLISFDLETHDFSSLDLYGASLPFIYYEDFFHYNNFKIVETGNWLIAVWQDCLNALYASQGIAGYEEWLDVVEIAICISADSGETWSEPIFLNSNETPELTYLIPSYVYPGDVIEDLGNNHGKLHLFFFNDNSYGSFINGYGQDLGGTLMYTSLDIDFEPFTDSPEIVNPAVQIELTNYPNPFNPSTTICFSIEQNQQNELLELVIYNLKGQRVKSFLNHQITQSPNHQIVWDGTDQTGKPVSSGVYFAKLKAGNQIVTCKMLLMK